MPDYSHYCPQDQVNPGPIPPRTERTPQQLRDDRKLAVRLFAAAVPCVALAALVAWLWR